MPITQFHSGKTGSDMQWNKMKNVVQKDVKMTSIQVSKDICLKFQLLELVGHFGVN